MSKGSLPGATPLRTVTPFSPITAVASQGKMRPYEPLPDPFSMLLGLVLCGYLLVL